MKTTAQHRVRTGHGKPGKSWNLWFQFLGLESHGIVVKVINSLGKATCFQKIKQQKDKEFEKITDESETGFNWDKHIFYAYIYNAGNYVIKWLFDTGIRTNAWMLVMENSEW